MTLNDPVVNLSTSFSLTKHHRGLLEKGLTFVPTTTLRKNQRKTTKAHLRCYHRRLKLVSYFGSSTMTAPPKFQLASTWEPEDRGVPRELVELIQRDRVALTQVDVPEEAPNLTKGEKMALEELSSAENLVIKPADKGSAVVIMDRQKYVQEAHRQLRNSEYYLSIQTPIYPITEKKVHGILDQMRKERNITKKQLLYLKGTSPARPRYFYLLPKIHKDPATWPWPYVMPPGRPIVSDCGSESYGSAELLDHHLNPLSVIHPSYIKDTNDFIQKVRALTLTRTCLLFSMGVENLYTNIETAKGLEAVKGTAMGKRFSPAYANIYMAEWEEVALACCTKKPIAYLRYLDDIWGIWGDSREDFDLFLKTLNDQHPSINLTAQISEREINFLDTTTFKGPEFNTTGKLDVRVFFKPTDTHALLHKQSFHPKHTFKGLIYSQLLRFERICTRSEDREEATRVLFKALRQRGYSRSFLRRVRLQTGVTDRGGETQDIKRIIIPLISTYNTYTVKVHRKIKQNLDSSALTDLKGRHKVVSAFKRNPNLKDWLVSTKMRTGSSRSARRSVGVITDSQKKEHFFIQTGKDLATKNAIYCVSCRLCDVMYVGQTRNDVRSRLHSHRYNITHNQKRNTHLVRHFRRHGLHNLSIRVLESCAGWTQKDRESAEMRWVKSLKTKYPRGLNLTTTENT
nr:uncharacterized protein LOC125971932 isoform X2 [Syngnathus scovelli]